MQGFSNLVKYKAMYVFDASREDELTLREGDIVNVILLIDSFIKQRLTYINFLILRMICQSKLMKVGYSANATVDRACFQKRLRPSSPT